MTVIRRIESAGSFERVGSEGLARSSVNVDLALLFLNVMFIVRPCVARLSFCGFGVGAVDDKDEKDEKDEKGF